MNINDALHQLYLPKTLTCKCLKVISYLEGTKRQALFNNAKKKEKRNE